MKHRDYKEDCLCGVQYIHLFLLVVDSPCEKNRQVYRAKSISIHGHLIECYLSLIDGSDHP